MREEYKQTPIGSIPKDWNVVRLRDVLTHLRNGLTTKHNKEGKGYPVTRIETISYERIDPNKVGFVYRHRDLHKEVCYATALDKEGEIIDRREFKNERGEWEKFIEEMPEIQRWR